jgi:hypothetical protein
VVAATKDEREPEEGAEEKRVTERGLRVPRGAEKENRSTEERRQESLV